MTTTPPPEETPLITDRPAPVLDLSVAERAAARSRSGVWSLAHLRTCWAVLLTGELLLGIAAGIVSGGGGVLGVVVGTAIVGFFFTFSTVVIAVVGARRPKKVMLAALGSYAAKIIALGIVMVLIPRDGAMHPRWMAAAVGIGVFCWLGAHMRYVLTTKIFYVDPA